MDDIRNTESRLRAYRQLRQRSDKVRTELIPAAVEQGVSAETVIFDITRSYFEGDIQSGQLLKDTDLSLLDSSKDQPEPFQASMMELTRPRSYRCSAVGFEMLHPRYLKGVCKYLFDALDEGRADRRRGPYKPDPLMLVHFILHLIHVTEDGTGRSGEDMLVLLAQESGQGLTFSRTGYRDALEGEDYPIFFKTIAQKFLFFELVGHFYQYLGLPKPTSPSYDIMDIALHIKQSAMAKKPGLRDWPDGLEPEIERIYKDVAMEPEIDQDLFLPTHPYRYFAGFLAREVIYFILCLQSPSKYRSGLKKRYPASVANHAHVLSSNLGRIYHPIPEDIGEECDHAITLIEQVRMGWVERDDEQLDRAVTSIERNNPEIGRLFRHELPVFLTEEEKETLKMHVSPGITGKKLENLMLESVKKVHC